MDLLPILEDGTYKNYDCCLGSRFMKGSKIGGYSALRVVGNHGFNWLFSVVARKDVYKRQAVGTVLRGPM